MVTTQRNHFFFKLINNRKLTTNQNPSFNAFHSLGCDSVFCPVISVGWLFDLWRVFRVFSWTRRPVWVAPSSRWCPPDISRPRSSCPAGIARLLSQRIVLLLTWQHFWSGVIVWERVEEQVQAWWQLFFSFQGGERNTETFRLLHAKNIQRPQLKFKDKVDNSNTPFVSKIFIKPNAEKPLPSCECVKKALTMTFSF